MIWHDRVIARLVYAKYRHFRTSFLCFWKVLFSAVLPPVDACYPPHGKIPITVAKNGIQRGKQPFFDPNYGIFGHRKRRSFFYNRLDCIYFCGVKSKKICCPKAQKTLILLAFSKSSVSPFAPPKSLENTEFSRLFAFSFPLSHGLQGMHDLSILVLFQNADMAVALWSFFDKLNFAFDHPRREFVRSFSLCASSIADTVKSRPLQKSPRRFPHKKEYR